MKGEGLSRSQSLKKLISLTGGLPRYSCGEPLLYLFTWLFGNRNVRMADECLRNPPHPHLLSTSYYVDQAVLAA
jgi:hypothetical protein